jgi:nucleotidyltransferase/DNA polymerase involved in DNA repair
MVVCVHLPRFELVIAAGGPRALAGRALAIAPTPGGEARVGEVSGAAEAYGVTVGMVLGEALARCPELVLVPADPLGVARVWEGTALGALEEIGAAPESARPGLAYFMADGLRGIHGGDEGVIAATRRALGPRARVGAGPTRFCALAAALQVRSRRAMVYPRDAKTARRYLAREPVGLLGFREETAALVGPLGRLGVRTLGELAGLGRAALTDRFGEAGRIAYGLARGEDTPLCARLAQERLEESMELPESSSGPALERVLGLLVERLLARSERRGRTLRAVILSARLVESGTWRERVVFRQALVDPRRMRLALSVRLALLPAPAEALALAVERFGPPSGRQGSLLDCAREVRLERLGEGVAQVRALAGAEAALRALCVDPGSRVPERRVVLAPWGPGTSAA